MGDISCKCKRVVIQGKMGFEIHKLVVVSCIFVLVPLVFESETAFCHWQVSFPARCRKCIEKEFENSFSPLTHPQSTWFEVCVHRPTCCYHFWATHHRYNTDRISYQWSRLAVYQRHDEWDSSASESRYSGSRPYYSHQSFDI